jgi:hypothetical protein
MDMEFGIALALIIIGFISIWLMEVQAGKSKKEN